MTGRTIALAVVLAVAAPAAGQEVVRVGDLPAFSTVAFYVALEKGFFAERGIRVETEVFASASRMTSVLGAGHIDAATGAPTAALFDSLAGGAGFRIVADKGQVRPGFNGTLLTVRKDLVDSGQVKSAGDLKGRTVGTGARGTTADFFLAKMMEDAGLGPEALTVSHLGYPEALKALGSGAVDALWAPEPWGARAEELGVGVRLVRPESIKSAAIFQTGLFLFSERFRRERPKVAREFLAAYLKGARRYADAGPKDPDVLAAVARHTRVPLETVKASLPFYVAPDGRPRVEDLMALQAFFLAREWIKAVVPAERMLDLSHLPEEAPAPR